MKNLWRQIQESGPVVVLLLLSILIAPVVLANGSNNGNGAAASVTTGSQTTTQITPLPSEDTKSPKTATTKVAPKPQERSVLDAEVLESPVDYFKKAFSSEEDEASAAPNSGAVMMTIKVLVAMLLSTIM